MRAPSVIILLAVLVLPTAAFAEVQTFTATHTYILGDHDSKDDASQRCLLEAKRKVLEQAGVYIESASEVKNFDLTKDKITSFAAAVMQVKDTKEEVSFQQGQMMMTLKLTAQVDLAEVRKQLAARQVDAGVRDDVAMQKERLKLLEAQLEAMQQQMQQAPGRAPSSPPSNISAADVQWLRTQAAQGNAMAQFELGLRYNLGNGVPKDYATARQWYEKAAAQGNVHAQSFLGFLYYDGNGVPQDYVRAYMWHNLAAAHSTNDAQNLAVDNRETVARRMTPAQIAEAQRLSQQCQAQQFKDC
jgi:TPR repeat protein